MTWSQVLVDIIMCALVTVIGFVIRGYVVPYIQNNHLAEVAKILVKAAEAIYGAGHGADKLQYCIEQINKKYHINVDPDVIFNAIQAAWLELDEAQKATEQKAE